MNTLDVAQFLNRLKHHHHHDGRAVRVSDDATRAIQRISSIALRHHQWHIVVHTEGAGVVNHHGAKLGDVLSKLLRSACTSRREGDINALEVIAVLQKLHFILLATECVFPSGTTSRAEKHEFVNWEISLIKNTKEFLSYGTTGTDDCYFHLITLLNDFLEKRCKGTEKSEK